MKGRTLTNWQPKHDNWFAILASGVHVENCRCRCYTLESTAIISEKREVTGADEQLLRVIIGRMAQRTISFDKSYPLPVTSFRCHLVSRLGEGAGEIHLMATVNHANKSDFAEQLARRFVHVARLVSASL